LTPRDRYNESLMTGLRTARGIHPESLRTNWGKSPEEVDVMAWKKALEQGALIPSEEGRYRIPEPLWITGDQVSASLFWLDENATSCP
jgi:coproporphyrinogen III oxidase-like Fe-S oxidoreductase